jgi:hypothetical protein
VDECRLLGPLIGGVGKRGDSSRLTLAKIVRGIAAGDVRKYCEDRERMLKVGRLTAARGRGGEGLCGGAVAPERRADGPATAAAAASQPGCSQAAHGPSLDRRP